MGNRNFTFEAIFIVNLDKKSGPKLRTIILLHCGLVTFTFHFGRNQKVRMRMFFGPGGHDHDFQNQLFLFLGTPNDLK